MAHYLIEVGYTPQAWTAQIDSQANVIDRITPAEQAAGGTIQSIYYTFGESDLVGIIDFPTAEDAAGFALAVTGSGALRSYRTTPLLTVDQGIASMARAAQVRAVYAPPRTVDLEPTVPVQTR